MCSSAAVAGTSVGMYLAGHSKRDVRLRCLEAREWVIAVSTRGMFHFCICSFCAFRKSPVASGKQRKGKLTEETVENHMSSFFPHFVI